MGGGKRGVTSEEAVGEGAGPGCGVQSAAPSSALPSDRAPPLFWAALAQGGAGLGTGLPPVPRICDTVN